MSSSKIHRLTCDRCTTTVECNTDADYPPAWRRVMKGTAELDLCDDCDIALEAWWSNGICTSHCSNCGQPVQRIDIPDFENPGATILGDCPNRCAAKGLPS